MIMVHSAALSPARIKWALLLFIGITAVTLRLLALNSIPPGLYRDEAYNGLDALAVLDGEHPLFFEANNGREPLYIYLTAVSIRIVGNTATAVRLPAAFAGALTTLFVYKLAAAWFGQRTGLFAAWLWAVTLWPVHLSRIGLRPILFVPLFAATLWLGTLAYRKQTGRYAAWRWVLAGVVYGLAFYTYLPIRFTPILFAIFSIYFVVMDRSRLRRLRGLGYFLLTTAVITAPLIFTLTQTGGLLGRSSQVSILNPAINDGDLFGTLWRQIWATAGMFFWHGDDILRHNPAGRPVFDLLLLIPFIWGLGYTLKRWRRMAAILLLLWTAVMLGPTILAEDAPHFLRAVGALPAILFFPAIGLSEWWRVSGRWGHALILSILALSLLWGGKEYAEYGRSPDTAYLFEQAASDMAAQINADEGDVFVARRFWDNWTSIRYLNNRPVAMLTAESVAEMGSRAAVYFWPYEAYDFIREGIPAQSELSVMTGSLARGDLEPEAYPLYGRFSWQPASITEAMADFGDFSLMDVRILSQTEADLRIETAWKGRGEATAFIHVLHGGTLIGQSDMPIGSGYLSSEWLRPSLTIRDQHQITLSQPYNPASDQLLIGLYNPATGERLGELTIDN